MIEETIRKQMCVENIENCVSVVHDVHVIKAVDEMLAIVNIFFAAYRTLFIAFHLLGARIV